MPPYKPAPCVLAYKGNNNVALNGPEKENSMELTSGELEALDKGHTDVTTCGGCGSSFISAINRCQGVDGRKDKCIWLTPCPFCYIKQSDTVITH
jgi:hypothetical protein